LSRNTVLAATSDTVFLWQHISLNDIYSTSLQESESKIKLNGISITYLKAFEGGALVGTECGTLYILDTETQSTLVERRSQKLSDHAITSIRLFKGKRIKATVCFNDNNFLSGKISGYKFIYKSLPQDYQVQEAQYIGNWTTHKLLTFGTQVKPFETRLKACIQDEEVDQARYVFNKEEYRLIQPRVLDVSAKGVIYLIDKGGLIYLWDSRYGIMDYTGSIGNSLNNGGGIGLLIPNELGHSILYAGGSYDELNITSFRAGRSLSKFNWEPNRDGRGKLISSIDYYENFIVLGLRHSIIIFKLGCEGSTPTEADKLHQALQEYYEDDSSTEEAGDDTVTPLQKQLIDYWYLHRRLERDFEKVLTCQEEVKALTGDLVDALKEVKTFLEIGSKPQRGNLATVRPP